MLDLKRFNPLSYTKKNSFIAFDETLSLSALSTIISNEDPIFDLYSTIDHIGTIDNGHYIAEVK